MPLLLNFAERKTTRASARMLFPNVKSWTPRDKGHRNIYRSNGLDARLRYQAASTGSENKAATHDLRSPSEVVTVCSLRVFQFDAEPDMKGAMVSLSQAVHQY
jgi:hypothetical protein